MSHFTNLMYQNHFIRNRLVNGMAIAKAHVSRPFKYFRQRETWAHLTDQSAHVIRTQGYCNAAYFKKTASRNVRYAGSTFNVATDDLSKR